MPKPSRRVVAAALVMGVAACRSAAPPAPAPAPSSVAAAAPATPAPAERPAPAPAAAPAPAEDPALVAARAAAERLAALVVYYKYDDADLDAEARQRLDQAAEALNAAPAITVRLEGHADERGAEEYNLALGMRRAAGAQRYLVSRGVAESRVTVVSFGEERPAATGGDESSWARNRRVAIVVTGGVR